VGGADAGRQYRCRDRCAWTEVLDVDDPAAARDLVARCNALGAPAVATARGQQFYFAGTDRGTVSLGFGELRGRGSYVVCPPSTHPTGKIYVWVSEPNGSRLPAVPDDVAGSRTTAGSGQGEPRETVPPGGMYDYLLDRATRLARAGERDVDVIERALVAAFEVKRVPGTSYNGDRRDTRRIAEWAARSEIADRERRRETGDSWLPAQRTRTEAPDKPPPTDRYAGRVRTPDAMTELLGQPKKPTAWRVHGLVADGTVTVLSAEAGMGKSILLQHLCDGVTDGATVAGILCTQGVALYIDGEMGSEMFTNRLRDAGASRCAYWYVDALGLDISVGAPDDLGWIAERIEDAGARFVVVDSLRRLMPSKSENDSDDMAPAVAAVAKLARDTGAAIVLVHHKGDGEKFYRGSTAIKDQADALFGLLPVNPDDDDDQRRRITCRGVRGKAPRYAGPPPDWYVEVSFTDGGVVAAETPEAPEAPVPVREAVAQAITAALPARTKTEVADKIGRALHDRSFREAWRDLEVTGAISEINGVWGW
jgi:hypothetical protein